MWVNAPSNPQGGCELPADVPQEDRSFESFFSAESGALYRRLVLILRDRGEAEDVMQEAFIRVWERWDRVQAMADPVGYLYRVSFRRSVQARRAAARRALRLLRAPRPDESDLADARMDAWLLLGMLTIRQRAALVLTDLVGYSSEEAGRILGGPAPGPASGARVTYGHTQATVTIVHRHLKNAQMDLYPIPRGYTPRIDADKALQLALAQLNHRLRIPHAHLYLGEFEVQGTAASATPAWVMVVGPSPSWCTPPFGSLPSPYPSPTAPASTPSGQPSCYFGVVIDANTGGLIVEG